MTPKQTKLVMKIGSCAPVYVFTFQASLSGDSGSRTNGGDGLTSPSDETAQNLDDAPSPQLTLAQVEAARNAAAAVLELVGATVVSTSSVLQIDAPSEDARLVLTPTVETLAELADAQTRFFESRMSDGEEQTVPSRLAPVGSRATAPEETA